MNFVPINHDIGGCSNTETDLVALDAENRDDDVIANVQRLFETASENKHDSTPCKINEPGCEENGSVASGWLFGECRGHEAALRRTVCSFWATSRPDPHRTQPLSSY